MDTEILEGLKRDCIVCEGVVKASGFPNARGTIIYNETGIVGLGMKDGDCRVACIVEPGKINHAEVSQFLTDWLSEIVRRASQQASAT